MLLHKILTQPRQRRFRPGALSAAVLALTAAAPVSAYEFDKPIEKALKFGQDENKYGQIKFDLRYRYEYVNQEDVAVKSANGNTLRLRLGYLTPEFHGLQAFFEYEGNLAMQEDYNSLQNGRTQYSVIADPQKQELNQGWITYKGIPDTVIKGGRQRIKIDNDRFIGNVGWRQLEQTYDSALITNKSIENFTAKAGFIGNVKNILSNNDNMTSPFLHLGYDFGKWGTLKGYAYWIDYSSDTTLTTSSNQTYGGSFVGSPKISDSVKAHYRAEYAWQQDYGTNPISYKDQYFHFMGGVTAFGVTLKGAIEQLDGDGVKGFDTPLATKHAFQGWADKFLRTPNDGVRDVQAILSSTIYGVKLMFWYHNFKDDTGNIDYGNEYDFLITKKFGKHYQLLAKYAYYDAEDFSTNTQKFWIQGSVNF